MSGGERIAVADLGTNSTRLLVADLDLDGRLTEVDHRTRVTRLGEGVDASGRLAPDAIERVLATLEDFRRITDGHGVARLVAVATSAVRDADNGARLARQVRDRCGFDVRTITGEEEARLTFLGATAGRDGAHPTLVIDIGGGSTEYVVGRPGAPPSFRVSTRLGSVRHTERHLPTDPPPAGGLQALAAAAREIVAAEVPAEVRDGVHAGIAVAGTTTSLAAVDLGLDPYDSARVHGHRLTLDACERMLEELAAVPLRERRRVPGLHPDRAPTIVAGAVILVESIRAFGLASVETSEADILHGVALAATSGGST